MRGEIVPKILEILQAQAETTATLFDIFFSGYHESYRKTKRMMLYGPHRFDKDWASVYRERQKFYSLLNQLKNQGLIKKKDGVSSKRSIWQITKRGVKKWQLIKKQPQI